MEKRFTIGVIIGNVNSPHVRTLMRGICNAAKKMNVNIIFFLGVHMSDYYREYFGDNREGHYDFQYNVVYDYANLADVDGVVIAYGSLGIFLEDRNRKHFLSHFKDMPYVLVEDRDESMKGSSVISDNYNGMCKIVEHLIVEHGCKDFLFLSGPNNNTDAIEREKAFRDTLGKHGIPFDESRYAEGDFSQCCNEQIACLLDRHPHADAFVCANDVMAETVYKECMTRNIEVGRDIAVTGYDDWDMAERLMPPLTTAMQDELDMGQICVKRIVELCKGNTPLIDVVPAAIKIRSSCGCSMISGCVFPDSDIWDKEGTDAYLVELSEAISRKVMISNASEDKRKLVKEHLYNLMYQNRGMYENPDQYIIEPKVIRESIDKIVLDECSTYISVSALTEVIYDYVEELSKKELFKDKTKTLLKLAEVLLESIQQSVIKRQDEERECHERNMMFIPLVSRDMLANIDDEVAFYESPMKILKVLGVKGAYLYLLKNPQPHHYAEKWNFKQPLWLASYLEDGKIVSYNKEDRPLITKEAGMSSFFEGERERIVIAFSLFQGVQQYGIFLVETDPAQMQLMHLVCMQISSSMNFFHMYQRQIQMQKQLECLVEEINEKNKILGFISEYDELTGVMNRRGFMERAMEFAHDNSGHGVLLIADLDHLKEINDSFGHVAGDFAIRSAAGILMTALGEDTLIARIGGDEFVALLPYESELSGDIYIDKLRKAYGEFNKSSKKEFYVELSAGYTIFSCEEEMDFESILADSDKMLYEAKQLRRSSIKKMQ